MDNRDTLYAEDAKSVWAHLLSLNQARPTHELVEMQGQESRRHPQRGIWAETGTRRDVWMAPNVFEQRNPPRRAKPKKFDGVLDVAGDLRAICQPCMLHLPLGDAPRQLVYPKGLEVSLRRSRHPKLGKVWLVKHGFAFVKKDLVDEGDHVRAVAFIALAASWSRPRPR